MPQTLLTDEVWLKLKAILHDARIYDKPSLRLSVEGMLYRIKNGCPWRTLPHEFGNWNSISKRFSSCSPPRRGMDFYRRFNCACTSVLSRRREKSNEMDHAIGLGFGARGTIIHLAADSSGNPVNFEITGAEVNRNNIAPKILGELPKFDYLIADEGYDSDDLREQIRLRRSERVITKRRNSKTGDANIDWGL